MEITNIIIERTSQIVNGSSLKTPKSRYGAFRSLITGLLVVHASFISSRFIRLIHHPLLPSHHLPVALSLHKTTQRPPDHAETKIPRRLSQVGNKTPTAKILWPTICAVPSHTWKSCQDSIITAYQKTM